MVPVAKSRSALKRARRRWLLSDPERLSRWSVRNNISLEMRMWLKIQIALMKGFGKRVEKWGFSNNRASSSEELVAASRCAILDSPAHI